MKLKIVISDDHRLFLKSLSMLVQSFPGFEVVGEALHGAELLKIMALQKEPPDLALIDVNTPVMNGPQTVTEITARYPLTRCVALSMKEDDHSILSMLRAGSCAYLLKDVHPDELEKALHEVHTHGFYNADIFNLNYRRIMVNMKKEDELHITERERDFLRFACSDLTYHQIAAEMFLAPRTIDGYRESLFEKLNVKSRVGLALEAIRRKLVVLD